MNIAIIFAGGSGKRMNSRTLPKQFLKVYQKPIIIYTLEQFEKNQKIDSIVLVCLEPWIEYCQNLIDQYRITKVQAIVPGGDTGQRSIFNGLKYVNENFKCNPIVVLHDGVRPLVSQETINKAIECTEINGSAITVSPAVETIVMKPVESDELEEIVERSRCQLAKAPQCFYLSDIMAAHEKAIKEGKSQFVDSATLMRHYGYKLFAVQGEPENIKITTPSDYYLFKALLEAKENSEIFG